MARNLLSRAKAALTRSPDDLIAGLEKTKSDLAARLPALETAKTAALDRRREALIAGGDAADAARAVRAAEDDLAAVTDALAEVERRLADTVAKRDAAAVRAEREAVANKIEAEAKRFAVAVMEVGSAIAALAAAHERLSFTLSDGATQIVTTEGPGTVADTLVLKGLAAALPDLGLRSDLISYSPWVTIVEGEDVAAGGAAVSERLRSAAAGIRNGAASSELPGVTVENDFMARVPQLLVYVTTPFIYTDRHPQMVVRSHRELPQPVAERAVAKGLAAVEMPADWDTMHGSADLRLDAPIGWADCFDIEFDLAAWKAADIERQRAEWRAAQDVKRADLERRAA